jgi:biopolymer transport protein ExbD
MAEFNTNAKSPHIDMTPMVDLGFLLITFFMLASSFSKPKVIDMLSPTGGIERTKLNCNRALTLLIDETDFVKYYTCPPLENVPVDSVDFSKNGLRALILKQKEAAKVHFNNEKPLIVLLKATEKAHYKHLIDAIDELSITNAVFTLAKMEVVDSAYLSIKN